MLNFKKGLGRKLLKIYKRTRYARYYGSETKIDQKIHKMVVNRKLLPIFLCFHRMQMAALSMLIIMREIQHGCDQGMYFFYLSFLHSFFSIEVKVFMITFRKVSFQHNSIWCCNIVFKLCSWSLFLRPAQLTVTCSKPINRNTTKRCEICSKLTIKTPVRRQWRCSGIFIVNFEYISHLFLVILLMTLNK